MQGSEMLVRVEGGDVIRRAINYIDAMEIGHPPLDTIHIMQQEPVLNDDEMIVRYLGDPIPTIIKTR